LIDITGLDKADVLAALYNASQPRGTGFLHFDPDTMTRKMATKIIGESRQLYFGYLKGRVMKIKLSGDYLDEESYDHDNGSGTAARALAPLIKARYEKGASPP
jgi:hypothetical protein